MNPITNWRWGEYNFDQLDNFEDDQLSVSCIIVIGRTFVYQTNLGIRHPWVQ